MSRVIGYVIVKALTGQLYAGHRHPATEQRGRAVWVEHLENPKHEGGNAAVYGTQVEATNIARAIREQDLISATVSPVWLE